MKASLKAIELLQQRFKNISSLDNPEELHALANVAISISKLETTDDILNLSNEKLEELLKKANSRILEVEMFGNLKQTELGNHKSECVITIDSSKQNSVEELSTLTSEHTQAINFILDDFETMNDVPEQSTVVSEISFGLDAYNFLNPEDLPFVFGILSRYDDYFNGFTSTFGTWYNSGADTMLGFLTGSHEYTSQYSGFYVEPKLRFLQGSKGNFIKKRSYTKYQQSTSQYKYPHAALGCLFVKNVTNDAITSTITFGGSSYSSTGGAGMFVGIPDYVNELITWTNVYSYSSSSATISNSASITVPANTTICILFYTSSYYISSPSNSSGTSYYYHAQFIHWRLNNIRSEFLVEGLEIDFDMTLKAWQCSGLSNPYSLWRD